MTAINLLWGPGVHLPYLSTGALGGYALNDADDAVAWRFCVPKTGDITKVGFYATAETGTSPEYNVGLVTVDSSGNPTQTAYGSSVNTTVTVTAAGWHWVTLATSASAAAVGEFAAVHIWPTASTPDGSNYATILYSPPIVGNGTSLNYAVSWAAATNWGATMAVEYDDGSVYGMALGDATIVYDARSNTDPDEYGVKFTVPVDMTVYGGRFWCPLWGSAATGDMVLYDDADTVLKSYTITDKDFVENSDAVDVFWVGQNLVANTIYRLVVKPAVTTNGDIYIGRLKFDSATAKNALPGTDGFQLTYRTDAGAWTDEAANVALMALWVSDITFATGGGGAFAYVG